MSLIKPQELEAINSDILIAKKLLYDKSLSSNPYITNQIAYHSSQAIEKTLKAIIRDGGKMTSSLSTSHNIDALMIRAERCRVGIIHEYPLISENSDTLSKFNILRYCGKGINKSDAVSIFKEARRLYQEVENEYLKESPNKNNLRQKSLKEYRSLEKLKINKPSELSFEFE